jgi:hypothetical protein
MELESPPVVSSVLCLRPQGKFQTRRGVALDMADRFPSAPAMTPGPGAYDSCVSSMGKSKVGQDSLLLRRTLLLPPLDSHPLLTHPLQLESQFLSNPTPTFAPPKLHPRRPAKVIVSRTVGCKESRH